MRLILKEQPLYRLTAIIHGRTGVEIMEEYLGDIDKHYEAESVFLDHDDVKNVFDAFFKLQMKC
jgi:hypothetical protein